MKEITIELTSKCEFNCLWCSSARKENIDLPFEKVIEALNKGKEDGFTHVRFSGGEPTLYPDLNASIIYARQLDYHITLLTNGLSGYFNAGLDQIEVQWHSNIKKQLIRLKRVMNANLIINVVNLRESEIDKCFAFAMKYNIPVHIMKLQLSGNAFVNRKKLHPLNITITGEHGCSINNKLLYLPTGEIIKCASNKAKSMCPYGACNL